MEPKHFPVRPLDRDAPVKDLLLPAERKPEGHGPLWHFVYRFYDAAKAPLYIGITSCNATRWDQHRKHSEWWLLAEYVAVSVYGTSEELEAAEKAAIRREQPQFNRQFKRWPTQTAIRLDGKPEDVAAHLFSVARPEFLHELARLLAAPERFPQPAPPPLPDFTVGMAL